MQYLVGDYLDSAALNCIGGIIVDFSIENLPVGGSISVKCATKTNSSLVYQSGLVDNRLEMNKPNFIMSDRELGEYISVGKFSSNGKNVQMRFLSKVLEIDLADNFYTDKSREVPLYEPISDEEMMAMANQVDEVSLLGLDRSEIQMPFGEHTFAKPIELVGVEKGPNHGQVTFRISKVSLLSRLDDFNSEVTIDGQFCVGGSCDYQ